MATAGKTKLFMIGNLPPVPDLEDHLKKRFGEGVELQVDRRGVNYVLVRSNDVTEEGIRKCLAMGRFSGSRDNAGTPNRPEVTSLYSYVITMTYTAVSFRLACIMQQLATELRLNWDLTRDGVNVTGSIEAIKEFRDKLNQKIFDNASELQRKTATLTSVINALSDLPSMEKLSRLLHVRSPASSVATPVEAVLKEWISTDNQASIEKLAEVLVQIGKQDVVQHLLSSSAPESTCLLLDDGGGCDRGGGGGGSTKKKTILNLSPDVLHLLEKLPDGDIEGVVYKPSEGAIIIQRPTPEAVDECITKFQDVYQKILSHDGQLQVVTLVHSPSANSTAVSVEVANLNEAYKRCVFVYAEGQRLIKLVSDNARQFEQAHQALVELVKKVSGPPGSGWGGGIVHTMPLQSGRVLTLKQCDLITEAVDVIVNAANDKLKHWGGVAGALNDATNGKLQKISDDYTKKHGQISVGDVAVTASGGGKLKCKHVYHVVGPDGKLPSDECKKMIAKCIEKILTTAEKDSEESLALPAISTGVFGVDKELVAKVIIDTIVSHRFTTAPPVLRDIRIVIIDKPTFDCFAKHFSAKTNGYSLSEGTQSCSGRKPSEVEEPTAHYSNGKTPSYSSVTEGGKGEKAKSSAGANFKAGGSGKRGEKAK